MVNLFCSYDFGFVRAPSENGSQKIFDTKTVRNQIIDVIDIAFNMWCDTAYPDYITFARRL